MLCHQACLRKGLGSINFLHMRKAGGTTLSRFLLTHVNLLGAALTPDDEHRLAVRFEAMLTAMEQGKDSRSLGRRKQHASTQDPPSTVTLATVQAWLQEDFDRLLGSQMHQTQFGKDGCGMPTRKIFVPTAYAANDGRGAPMSFRWNEGDPFVPREFEENSVPHLHLTHLRDPIKRIVSDYKMLFRNGGGPHGRPLHMDRTSLGEWLNGKRAENIQRGAQLAKDYASILARARSDPLVRKSFTEARLHNFCDIFVDGGWHPENKVRWFPNNLLKHLTWEMVSNYYVKQLAMVGMGRQVDVPTLVRLLQTPGTRADLERAKAVIEQFDIVLITDNGLGSPAEEDIVEEAIGRSVLAGPTTLQAGPNHPRFVLADYGIELLYERKVGDIHARSSVSEEENARVDWETPDVNWDAVRDLDNATTLARLREWNQLDLELIEFAKELVQRRHAAGARHHYLHELDVERGVLAARKRLGLTPSSSPDIRDPAAVPDWCTYTAETDRADCNFAWPEGMDASVPTSNFTFIPQPHLWNLLLPSEEELG